MRADADLIGIPVRLTLGNRSLKEGKVEAKLRAEGESSYSFALETLVDEVKTVISSLEDTIRSQMVHRELP